MNDPDSKLFTLSEAEKTRAELEPSLIEAMESRRKMADLEATLLALTERIVRMGGVSIPYEKTAETRIERDRVAASLQDAIDRIHSTGCVVKDLDVGLLDFPARMDNQNVYLCWRLGEDRIRFYHRQDEGFASRKPIDPRDKDYSSPIQ
ncbi:MAG TPA: DUF2203 domain-containing protein [Candidatus Acidoferrales bacterium]